MARLRADVLLLWAVEDVLPDTGRLCTWNLADLAEEARAVSKGLMFALVASLVERRDFLKGRPFGKDDFDLNFRLPIVVLLLLNN